MMKIVCECGNEQLLDESQFDRNLAINSIDILQDGVNDGIGIKIVCTKCNKVEYL